MGRLRYKLIIVLVTMFLIMINTVSASWWNYSYSAKVPVYIDGNTTLTDYQVPINLSYDSEMNSDFTDVRFINQYDNDTLDYWIETYSADSWAYMWVKVENITTNNDTAMYIYYGNEDVTSDIDNGPNTFEFFEDGTPEISWTCIGSPCPSFSSNSWGYNNRIWRSNGDHSYHSGSYVGSTGDQVNFTNGITIRTRYKLLTSYSSHNFIAVTLGDKQSGYSETDWNDYFGIYVPYDETYLMCNGKSNYLLGANDGNTHIIEMKYDNTNRRTEFYQDDSFVYNCTPDAISYNVTAPLMYGREYDTQTNYVDYYIGRKYTDVEPISSLSSENHQSNITLRCFELLSGTELTCSNSPAHPVNGTQNVTASVSGYYNITRELNISYGDNRSENYTGFYSDRVNFTARDLTTNSLIENFTVSYERLDGDYVHTGNVSTTNFTAVFNSIDGEYTFTFLNDDYASTSHNMTLYTTLDSYEFDVFTVNSINFTFKDEETKNVIDYENVSIELIGDYMSVSNSTSTGTFYIDLLVPSVYAIRYSAPSYLERFYYFRVLNDSTNSLTLYLLNSSSSSNITVTVIDEGANELEDAYILAQRYDVDSNSYVGVELAKTNFEGVTIMRLTKYDEFYKFLVYYPFGTLVKTTSPDYIYEDSLTIQVNTGDVVGDTFFNTEDVDGELTFNNATNNFRFVYSDPNSLISQGCLYVYVTNSLSRTLYNSSCVASTSATILIGVANTSGVTYQAQAFIYLSGEQRYIDSYFKTFPPVSYTGLLGLFMIALVTILFATLGIWNPSVALVLTPLPLLLGSVANFIAIPRQVAFGLEAAFIIVALILNKWS